MQRLVAFVLSTTFLASCHHSDADKPYVATGPLARVLVDSTGTVLLNTRPVSLPALADSFRALHAAGGAVIYSRSPYAPEANAIQAPVVRQVLSLIVAAKLPIRLIHPDSLFLPDSLLRK